ncbi:CidA/LrgA family protein [Rossellomorea aquimaris]|uniref:CidA/LrgA family protein n=1 Tax=Rossellomorea aquimaris TaxID=189382 RepID=UPI001CD7AFCB|nr:CidA/LrgA family protein [Rossellomorea aquimaris]MCA1053813.1 CidA/LrgA family protein [Rossellomorea aquimaris]
MPKVIIQILILCLLFEAGRWIEKFFHLPIPGSIIGMLILFSLLISGIMKERLLLEGANFFLKYFSFYFLPLSVSAVVLGPFLLQYGWKLILILCVSVLAGFAATSLWVRAYMKVKEGGSYD